VVALRILLVAPEEDLAALAAALENAGYPPGGMTSLPEQALHLAIEIHPDLYVLSLNAAEAQALAFMAQLKAAQPAALLALVPQLTAEVLLKAFTAGADAVLETGQVTERLALALAAAWQQYRLRVFSSAGQPFPAPAGSLVWDYRLTPDLTRLLDTNTGCRDLGYQPEELLAAPADWVNLLHPEDQAVMAGHLDQVRAHPEDFAQVNYRVITRSGEVRWLHHVCAPVFKAGRLAARRVLAWDVTHEHELEARFRVIFAEAPIGMALTDLQGRFQEVNLSLCRMLGYTPDELKGTDFNALTLPEDRALSLSYFEALLKGEMTSATFEKRYLHKSGRVIWVTLSTSLICDPQGHPRYFITMMRDITARKEGEALPRLQSAALEAAANGILITDRDGVILWANPALARMTGYELAELKGQTPRVFKSGDQDRGFYEQMWDTILAGQVWHGELVNRRKDGTLYDEELTITPLLDRQGQVEYFIAVKQDVTRRKRAEQEHERLLVEERRLRERAEALARASAVISGPLDLEALLRYIVTAAISVVPAAEKGSVLLPVDERGETLYVHTAVGYHTPALKALRLTSGYAIEAFRQKLSVIVPDVMSTHRIYPDLPEVGELRSAMAVPLIFKQRILGVLCLDNATRTDAFTAEDVRLIESFAAQAAAALANAHMVEQVQREQASLYLLYSLSRRLSEVCTPWELVEVVVEGQGYLQAEGCELCLPEWRVHYWAWKDESVSVPLDPLRGGEVPCIQAELPDRPLLVADTQTDRRWRKRPEHEPFPIRSVLHLPLRKQAGGMWGYLSYYHSSAQAFSEQHLSLLAEVAERISGVLDSLHLQALQTRYLEQQRRLTTLAGLLNRESELAALQRTFLPLVLELVEAESGMVALYDAARQAFVQPYHLGLPESPHWKTWPVEQGITGRAVRAGYGIVVNDYASQKEAVAGWKEAGLQSGIVQPIWLNDELVGLLECYRFIAARPFTQEDLALVEYAGQLLAVAWQRAHLYEAERAQHAWSSALLEAATVLVQHLDLDTVLDRIMEQAERVVAGDAFNIMLMDEAAPGWARVVRRRDRLGLRVIRDERLALADFPLLQIMAETQQPVLVQDTVQDARWQGATHTVRAYLGTPIVSRGKVRGFLNVNSTQPGRFAPEDAQRLSGFAAYIAIALENAVMYEKLQEHAQLLELRVAERTAALERRSALQQLEAEVARDVNASLTLSDMLQKSVELIVERLGMYHATLFLVDAENPHLLRRVASAGHAAQEILALDAELPVSQGLVGTAVRTGSTVRSLDVKQDVRHRFNPLLPDTRSEIALPLRTPEGIIGVLDVQSTQLNAFDESHALSLQVMADQIALSYQRLRLTEQVQAQYARLQAVMQSSADGILVLGPAGQVESYNATAESWLREATGAEREQFYALLRDLAARADLHPKAGLRLRARDLEALAVPIRDHQAGEVLITLHDITELKALDRMKTQFVSNVSHELRTPVTTILLYAALLKKTQGDEWREYLEAIEAEARRQARLVEDILTLSRFDAGRVALRLEPLDLRQVAEDVRRSHQALAHVRHLTLELEAGSDPVLVLGDGEKLAQVLNNLVENALNYTPAGGQVWVRVQTAGQDAERWGVVSVQDTGIGIPQEELPHIFERFYRGSEPQHQQIQGTGLGLAIVWELVQMHKGRITVESTVGQGSTFTVWLPLAETAGPEEALAPKTTE